MMQSEEDRGKNQIPMVKHSGFETLFMHQIKIKYVQKVKNRVAETRTHVMKQQNKKTVSCKLNQFRLIEGARERIDL